MGKILVINGADFSENALDQVSPSYNVVTKKTQAGVQFMDFDGVCAIRQMHSKQPAATYSILMVSDVTSYIGKIIKITSATPVTSGAYYATFSSDLGTLTFNDIPTMKEIPGSGIGVNYPVTPVGEAFNISSVSKIGETITKTIPLGAKYLLVTIRTDEGFNVADAKVVVELES